MSSATDSVVFPSCRESHQGNTESRKALLKYRDRYNRRLILLLEQFYRPESFGAAVTQQSAPWKLSRNWSNII